MNIIYKGYTGRICNEAGEIISYSGAVRPSKGGKYTVQVEGINETLIATADSLEDTPFTMRKLVEDYFETCRQVGKRPEQPSPRPSVS